MRKKRSVAQAENNSEHKKLKSSNNKMESKMPPNKAFNINVKSVKSVLNTKIKSNEFFIQNRNKNMSVIHTTTLKNYNTAIELLRELKAKWYTYTPKEVRCVNIVLKGIHCSFV